MAAGLGSEMIDDDSGADLDCRGGESFQEEIDEMISEGLDGIWVVGLLVDERA